MPTGPFARRPPKPIRPQALLALAAAACTLAGPAQGADSTRKALAVLAQAKAASGGAAWDRITGWRETGRHGQTTYATLLDFRRYGARFASTRDGRTTVRGYDGQIAWEMGPDGKVAASRDPARLAEARQSAYGSAFGFFFSDRFPARFEDLGVRTDGGSSFEVIRTTPEGAPPFELWIDRSTHRVARLVDRNGPQPVTGRFSDERRVGGVTVPFRIDLSDGDPGHAQTGQVESVVLEPVPRTAFEPPKD